ncbi:MAG: hypothetical protein M1839_003210 [Geoglossum umbratile]|nr:MAG: hypothetical protein M1839_003210 [Geoglossum umbratile]
MASTITLKPPVRVVIETSPQLFDTYGGDQLIRKAVEGSTNSNVTIQPLITRIDRRAYIVFDYGVPNDDNKPQVVRLRVKLVEPSLSCVKLSDQRAYVNSVVDGDKKMNAKYGLSFPRVVDVRKKEQAKGTSPGTTANRLGGQCTV